MNNKGFGLTELIIFIVASLITLVVCVIVYDQNFGHVENTDYGEATQIIGDSIKSKSNENEEKEVEEVTHKKENKKYNDLEEKLLNSAKMYISDNYTGKTDKIIIKTSKLIEDGYMEQIIDPDNADVVCTGYVIYNGEFYYEAYLRCGDDYKTENYNSEFE